MTNPREIPPQYDPSSVEGPAYARWQAQDLFKAQASRSVRAGGSREPFVIVMPPPNVTAVLHMGHGLNNTVQDVIIRWRRMCGDETLWLPGTDHAGIATQNVVEKILRQEGRTRFDLGRDAFVARTAAFVDETGGTILQQLRALGASCDWTRTRSDVIIRWRRMCGDETLWLPGTDHAGIATQNVVEKILRQEGRTRFDLGRDAFVARTAAFVDETGGTILQQLRALGASCDWTRT